MADRYFTLDTVSFMAELAEHNNREWFSANKTRYEDLVKDPALRFIEAFAVELKNISPHFMATPRSLFRIYRDARFSRDKSPYTTWTGIQVRHDASKDVHAPGYYLHIEPGSIFVALGVWHPDPPSLRAIREHIVADPRSWQKASQNKKFTDAFRLSGDRLKRPPKGFEPSHELIEELKWKDYIAAKDVSQSFLTDAALPQELARIFKIGTPLMKFLCSALAVPF